MKEIEKIIKEFQNHPAIKFANDEIAVNALRSGGKGYTGEENLADWLRRALISYRKGIEAELLSNSERIQMTDDKELELRQCVNCRTMKNFNIHSKEKLCFRCLDRQEARREVEAELRKKIKEIGEKAQSFGMSYQTRGLIDKILSLLDDKRQ